MIRKTFKPRASLLLALATATLAFAPAAIASPKITRLNPPSALFSFNDPSGPYISRFLPGQRFDLQVTVVPEAGQTITGAQFSVDGGLVSSNPAIVKADVAGIATNSVVASVRAYSNGAPGVHTLSVVATQSDGQTFTAQGNFEVVGVTQTGRRAKNIIIMIGDGMGIAHRTAARVVRHGVALGKANDRLAMDTFPYTGLVITHSLNSIVTDSSPGAACYSSGNKANNNQQGVFPDDTRDAFDNPRVELIGEYLARTQGKSLGIVTTSDVFDATPGAFGTHTQNRGAGTGICDQYLDEAVPKANLSVLMGGGRKWFLPATTPGTARAAATDYVLPADLAAGWGVKPGLVDTNRDLLADFQTAGFAYAPDNTSLQSLPAGTTKLLGLFSFSNMNVAKDKTDKRRNPGQHGVVDDFGFPDQPMLDEMTHKALDVLRQNPNGFVLMVEGASIDKQAHNMDTERWILDTIEFDRAIGVAKQFAEETSDTLVVITADHECGGVNIIGSSRVTNADLVSRAATNGALAQLRGKFALGGTNDVNRVVGTYDAAGFPVYTTATDGYPVTTDVDFKMLIGYAADADRYEDWLTNPLPLQDSQQPFIKSAPLNTYPVDGTARDVSGGFFITGQIPDTVAAHTGSDIPLSAMGRGASQFTGVMDNTDVFFKIMQTALGGAR